MGRKKKTKICDKVSHGEADRISQLPEHLICEILYHLPTKDAVRTSVLSTQWRYLWLSVPGLDLEPFSSSNIPYSLVERFFDFHRESCIRKFRVNFVRNIGMDYCPTQWIDVVIKSRIQHLDVCCLQFIDQIPSSIYTCETLVHLRLYWAFLPNAEFVCLPCQ
ncbi:PREDICTED: F-box/FBD/LRR-repeat protein At1g51370-like [Camelina sativa]|uniref:F-box/FBD/LRR-repeat protein At1g51370-like n=1 Tax=Camelina sativa TaxID=90675 RepID=A0ABM1R9X5_CAMSA|nr:PREDICTED: F-box/FBD/LRR-repeat protein At1g51370-like [Camelina sativa]